jgi:two-component system chemotaxis sensor kinase CheA
MTASPAEKARLELLEEFRRTTIERIERITLAWVTLEKNPADTAVTQELQRELHTVKGEARMMGFADVSLIAHRCEALVMHAMDTSFANRDIGDVLLAAVDGISHLIQKRAGSSEEVVDLSRLMERFEAAMATGDAAPTTEKPAPEDVPDLEAAAPGEAPRTRLSSDAFFRVDVGLFGEFSLGITESVIAHSRHQHTIERMRQLVHESSTLLEGHGKRAADRLTALRGISQQLQRTLDDHSQQIHESTQLARELDHKARELRLVPIDTLLRRYIRAVRDLAAEHDKSIDVTVDGGDAALDKNVVDELADPLLHIIRNAVDHGIEHPDERVAAGKKATAHIQIQAHERGGMVTVEVSDDGRGIDAERVAERAIAMGLIDRETASELDEDALLEIIFRPGFSTRESATETSGRGVGMDVVAREMAKLGGTVSVSTGQGTGTTIQLRVPVTQALSRVLVVRTGSEWYAVPTTAVEAVIAVPEDTVERIHRRRAIRFRDDVVTLTEFGGLLGVDDDEASERAVVLTDGETRVALLVSDWRADVEVVVRPLGDLLAQTRVVSGACVLSEGDLVLVLNPAEMVAQAQAGRRVRQRTPAVDPSSVKQRTILLAEDSVITRTMVRQILTSLGYTVAEAENGRQALDMLRTQTVDLLLTDIDMPEMDGITLVREVRAQAHLENLPVVVLSTHGADEDKRRASGAGADAYLVKGEFTEGALRDAIARRLGE